MLAVASTGDVLAQDSTSTLFQATPIGPSSAQRFSKPPEGTEGTTRATQPAPPIASGAADTGFDSTGSIAKRRKAKPKPGSPHPLPHAGAKVLPPASPQTPGAPQVAVRNAYANVYKPPDAPVRRPRPPEDDPFGAVGIRVGTFLLKPAIEAGYGYDSNPNRTTNGPHSTYYTVAPELIAKSEWSRHEFNATLRGSYLSYDNVPAADRPTADVKIDGRLDATRDLRFMGEGRFLLGTDNPGSPNLQAGLAELPIYTTFGGTLGVAQRYNRLDLALKGSVDRTEYADSKLTDGSTDSNQDRNFFQYRVQGRATYEFTPGLRPFVELDADKREHDGTTATDTVDRSSHAFTPKAGLSFEMPKWLVGEISLGYTTRDYISPTLPTLRGWILDSSLIWYATGLTTVTLTANSRAEETTLSGVSGTLRRDVGLQVDHAFRRWLVGSVKAGFGQDEYVGSDRVDNRTSLSAIITYKWSRDLWLKGEFRQEWMNSTVPSADYAASIFLVGLRWQR